jgi:AcrR family transcriptional regulator
MPQPPSHEPGAATPAGGGAARVERRRDEIIEVAGRVFAEKGYHEAGIADIASELGMGHGTFYRYFRNKLDIAATVLDRAAAVIAERLIAEDPDASDTLEEYRAQVKRIVRGLFDLLDEHPYLVRFFSRQSLVVDPDRLAGAFDSFSAITARYLDNGVRKGFLRPDLDVEITAQSFVAALFDGIRRALRHPQLIASSERFVAATTSLMFEGIGSRTPRDPREGP